MHVIFMILIVASSTLGSQLLLKQGIAEIAPVLQHSGVFDFLFAAATSPWVLAALTWQVMAHVLWFFVLTQSRVSMAFAVSGSFFYLLLALASWFLFDEALNAWQWFGLLLISAGVVILNVAAPKAPAEAQAA